MDTIANAAVRSSVEVALFQVWTEQRPALLRRCRHLLRHSDADAEDAFGRATLAMVQSARDLEELRNPSAWVRELVRNACMDIHREKNRRREDALVPEEFDHGQGSEFQHCDGNLDPERTYLQRETTTAILHAVEALPPHLRIPLLMRVEDDVSYAAMASVLFDSEENLRKRVQVARRILGESLAGHYADNPFENVDVAMDDAVIAPVPSPIRWIHPVVRVVSSPTGMAQCTVLVPLPSVLPRYVPHRAQQLHRYVEKHPTGWRKRLILADMLFHAEHFEESVAHYRAVVTRKLGHWEAWTRLALALQYAGRSHDAVLVWRHLEDASASVGIAHYYRALSCLANERTNDAMEDLVRASSECAPALSTLAALHSLHGRFVDGLDAARRALEIDPRDVQALLVAHHSSTLSGQTNAAHEYLERALEVQADCVPSLLRHFEHVLAAHGPNRAAVILKKLARMAPNLPEVKQNIVEFRALRRARRAHGKALPRIAEPVVGDQQRHSLNGNLLTSTQP